MKCKKDRKPKLIIKTRNGGYTKFYVNGKWQRKVTNLDFHAGVDGKIPSININCEFDTLVCDSKGIPIIEDDKIVCKHHTVRI